MERPAHVRARICPVHPVEIRCASLDRCVVRKRAAADGDQVIPDVREHILIAHAARDVHVSRVQAGNDRLQPISVVEQSRVIGQFVNVSSEQRCQRTEYTAGTRTMARGIIQDSMERAYAVVSGIGAFAFAVFVASCSGATPAEKRSDPPPAPPTQSAASAPPLDLEWTDSDVEKNAAQVGYGAKRGPLLQRDAAGVLVFRPETSDDHVVLPFVDVPPYNGSRSLEVLLDVQTPGGPTCAANLQDQRYNVIAVVPCWTTGEQRRTVALAHDISTVRVLFQSLTREPVRLPARLRLIERR